MRKTIAFILAFMYLGLTSGLAVNIHYCMGEVAEVQFDAYNEAGCKCGKEATMPCCNHQFELVKVDDAHQQVITNFSLKTPEIALHTFDRLMMLLSAPPADTYKFDENIPPLISPPDICIRNCVFRI